MINIETIKPKDIIAALVLICCFILIARGINHLVSGLTLMIVTYYFTKRKDLIEVKNGED